MTLPRRAFRNLAAIAAPTAKAVSYTHLHLQVIVVEYEMHVIFISPVAGEQATFEEGCGLILIKPPAIQVIYVESEP